MSQDKKDTAGAVSVSQQKTTMENILSQWHRERPDINPSPMAICGEVWRAGEKLRQAVQTNLSRYDLDFAGCDVLLTLRRQGKDKSLSPSMLAKEMMLSTSAMTNRLDRLEKKGLLHRTSDPNDRRGLKITLTEEGYSLADDMVVTHVQTEENMLSGLTDTERNTLCDLLLKIKPQPF